MARALLSFVLFAIFTSLAQGYCIGSSEENNITDDCDSEIYCHGDLLKTIQLAEIFNDSKTFVDLSQINEPAITLANFDKLMQVTNNKPNYTELVDFLEKNFATGDELENVTLPDWKEHPEILKSIEDPNYREWAKNLNGIWKTLARKISEKVLEDESKHSLIYVKNPFIIPGGRFKEYYYWDSYWVIEGLLICGMKDTAKGIIENFLSLVTKFGFIPNGGRVYYLMRSQPPLLIPMMSLYYEYTKDVDFVKDNMEILEKEFEYWQRTKTVNVEKNGKNYKLARYVVSSEGPRPESYREDYGLAMKLSDEASRAALYNNLKAGAESGWDFSGRWFISEGSGEPSLINISTSHIIPVDLNCFIQRNARILSDFHKMLGHKDENGKYAKIAEEYRAGIDEVLWDEEAGTWFDYDMKKKQPRKAFYPTNLAPLYTNSYDRSKVKTIARRSIEYLKKADIQKYLGGTPTSLIRTGEQWDFPNAWPPLQSILVMGLYQTGEKEAMKLAFTLASRWLRSNYAGYEEYGKMFEKYDASFPGQGGGGGEYTNQEGFGWTNGVVLEFLYHFPCLRPSDNINSHEENYNVHMDR